MVRRTDPARRSVKLPDWPAGDQVCWEQAVTSGPLLDAQGAASHWRSYTQQQVIRGYGRWLSWLHQEGLLNPVDSPASRVTLDRLRRYIATLEALMAPASVAAR